jgi:hypothetical protein
VLRLLAALVFSVRVVVVVVAALLAQDKNKLFH